LYSADRPSCEKQWFISINGVPWRSFSNSTLLCMQQVLSANADGPRDAPVYLPVNER